MRIRVMLKGTNVDGNFVLKDMFEFPVLWTGSGKFDATSQSILNTSLERLSKDECDLIVIEKVKPEAVDNGDGTGSLKGKLVGMGF